MAVTPSLIPHPHLAHVSGDHHLHPGMVRVGHHGTPADPHRTTPPYTGETRFIPFAAFAAPAVGAAADFSGGGCAGGGAWAINTGRQEYQHSSVEYTTAVNNLLLPTASGVMWCQR